MHRVDVLADNALVRVYDARCSIPRSGYDAARAGPSTQVIFLRRGVFGVRRNGDDFIIDSGCLFVLDAGDVYSTSHPGLEGDHCTDLVPAPEVVEEWSHERQGRFARLAPGEQFAVAGLTRALELSPPTTLEAEETSLRLLAVSAQALGRPKPARTVRAGAQARVDDVRALLASAPTRDWRLGAIAQAVNCSPYHLSRQFHATTAETISRYLLRLRLGLALERLARGETSLSALAIETGFAHHSHFTQRFRETFGMTPAAARETLTSGMLSRLRNQHQLENSR